MSFGFDGCSKGDRELEGGAARHKPLCGAERLTRELPVASAAGCGGSASLQGLEPMAVCSAVVFLKRPQSCGRWLGQGRGLSRRQHEAALAGASAGLVQQIGPQRILKESPWLVRSRALDTMQEQTEGQAWLSGMEGKHHILASRLLQCLLRWPQGEVLLVCIWNAPAGAACSATPCSPHSSAGSAFPTAPIYQLLVFTMSRSSTSCPAPLVRTPSVLRARFPALVSPSCAGHPPLST